MLKVPDILCTEVTGVNDSIMERENVIRPCPNLFEMAIQVLKRKWMRAQQVMRHATSDKISAFHQS